MATQTSLLPSDSQPGISPRPRGVWPAWAIVATCGATIAYFQIVRVVDNGTTNALTGLAFVVGLALLGIWTAFFAPLARRTRWWCIAGGVGILAVLTASLRPDFNGNLIPRFAWRWQLKHDEALAAQPLELARTEIDVRPTLHDFPGFLGANRDAFVPDVHLATDWKARPPELLWKQPIGAGWSGFSVQGDAAVTLEQRGEQELISCYDLRTGRLQWFHAITARHHNDIGGDGPGSTPMLVDGRVYALGGTGVLRCLDVTSGKEIWTRDVLADVGTTYEVDRAGVWWGRSASPLIVDDRVVVPGGGPPGGPKVSLIAYNKLTGEIVWKVGKREVSYSSPSLATYGGVRQIVIVNEDNITGHDIETGAVLWEAKWEGSSNSTASASQTVPVADDRFFVSKGYSVGGGALFEVKHGSDDTWTTNKLWHNHHVLQTKLDNVVIKDGFVYGLSDGILQCVELKTGKRQWAGADYGHGQLLRVGDLLLVTTEFGEVALVELNSSDFHELTKFTALDGKTWNNPALSGNLLLVRNAQEAACYQLPLATDPVTTVH